MLLKILGSIDVISGLILIFLGAGINIQKEILIVLGIILLVKCLFGMLKDIGSWIDFIAAIVLIINFFFSLPGIISIIVGLVIIQKGVFSSL